MWADTLLLFYIWWMLGRGAGQTQSESLLWRDWRDLTLSLGSLLLLTSFASLLLLTNYREKLMTDIIYFCFSRISCKMWKLIQLFTCLDIIGQFSSLVWGLNQSHNYQCSGNEKYTDRAEHTAHTSTHIFCVKIQTLPARPGEYKLSHWACF